MTAADATETLYRYAFASALDDGGLRLATTKTDDSFFRGFIEHPKVLADALLVLARISRTRYYVPPGMLASILRAADPVVTVAPDALRFEAFSACCGVYARLDVDNDGLAVDSRTRGVTNVDVNPPLRAALASLRQSDPLHLVVTSDAIAVSTLDATVREEKVTLPSRWIRGFAEAQVALSTMIERMRCGAPAARRLIQLLPPSSTTRSLLWVVPTTGGQMRLASRDTTNGYGVPVAGPERLRAIEPLLRHATSLRGYRSEALASAWVVDLPGGRFTLALSPDKSRGFSGEGGLLDELLTPDPRRSEDARNIDASLAVGSPLNGEASSWQLSQARFDAARAALATAGRLGFDLESRGYFHRPFPLGTVDFDDLEASHPRIVAARALLADGAITRDDDAFAVVSGAETYAVREREGSALSCTCAWHARHGMTRGACKHVLAVRLWREAQ